MTGPRIVSWLTSLGLAIGLVGCASAPHSASREELAPNFEPRAFQDLLVVGVYEDRAFRAGAEATLVEELRTRGVAAATSHGAVADLTSLDDDDVLQRLLADGGHDGLLTVATLDEGYEYGYDDYLATRGAVYLLGGRPGAGTDLGSFIAWAGSGSYSLHVALWDAETLEPVWQVTTGSQSTGSESGDVGALADFVVQTLREKGLL